MKKNNLKKISAFLPTDLLKEAVALVELNQTDTLICALTELIARHKRLKALQSRRKFHFDYNVDVVRQRRTY